MKRKWFEGCSLRSSPSQLPNEIAKEDAIDRRNGRYFKKIGQYRRIGKEREQKNRNSRNDRKDRAEDW